jgi:signal transduction histidine kinase
LAQSPRGARLLDALPLILVLVLAAGVVAVSFVIVRRTGQLLDSISLQSETIRSLADTVESAVARQAAAIQNQLLNPDPQHRAAYEAARASEDSAIVHLDRAVGPAGPAAMSALSNVRLVLRGWHRSQDELLAGDIDAATYLSRLDAQADRFEDVVEILDEVESEAAELGAQRRAQIGRLQRLGTLLTTFLAVAAVIASAVAYRFRGGIRESASELMVRAREAEAAVRTRDEVLAIVSHDLRNALNAMAGAVELAQEATLPPERRTQHLALAMRSARGMNRLIADLLDVARMEEGKLSVEPRPESVQDLLAQIESGHAVEAGRRGVTLSVHPPERPVHARADGGRIVQVLGNLVGNAIKFTPEGGLVTVDATLDDAGDRVRFAVSDTGPGIPAEHLPRIFDRFYQVRAAGRAGVGLGLAIARGLVEAHGSRLDVRSRPGEGTTFCFDLPVVEPGTARTHA